MEVSTQVSCDSINSPVSLANFKGSDVLFNSTFPRNHDVVFLLVVSKVAMFTLEAETKSHECILQTTKLIILVLTLQNVAFQEE
jgi:hypothetical protein